MENLHATGLVLNGIGVMLRGPSGAGKSLLALQLIDHVEARNGTGALVSDDRVDVEIKRGGLYMSAPPSLAGLVELRGRGIVKRPHKDNVKVDLVVDLVDEMVRMVEEEDLTTEIMGLTFARCPIPHRGMIESSHQMLLVSEAIAALKPKKTRASAAKKS